jgi:hypothetical protein
MKANSARNHGLRAGPIELANGGSWHENTPPDLDGIAGWPLEVISLEFLEHGRVRDTSFRKRLENNLG